MLDVSLATQIGTFHLELSFVVEQGKTTVLLGESGAGKSTVLRLLAGLLVPQQGQITFNETIYYDHRLRINVPPQERPFGYVFQDYVLFPHLNVFENVAFGLRAQHFTSSHIRQRVAEALELVHLAGCEQRRPEQLSGGQQQRVALARALALQPQLLLLDEPLAALDIQTRREVRQELRYILAVTQITTILVTHQYVDALLFGQQILVLDRGQVIQQGGQEELRERPRSSYVAELVGVNFFRGQIIGYEPHLMCIVQLVLVQYPETDRRERKNLTQPPMPSATGHFTRTMPNTSSDFVLGAQSINVVASLKEHSPLLELPAIGTEAYVVVDPHSITLYATPPESSARNIFQGEIAHILRLGAGSSVSETGRVRVSIMLGQHRVPLTAEITEASAVRMVLKEGQWIYATFKATEANAYL